MIKESEMDWISTPWVTVCLAQLLLRCVIAEGTPKKGVGGTDMPEEREMNIVVKVRDSTHVGPF